MEFQTVGALIGNVGIAAVLAWYLWYNTSIAGPARDKAQATVVESLVAAFRTDIQSITTTFRTDLEAERVIKNGLIKAVGELTHEFKERPYVEYNLLMRTEKAAQLFLANAEATATRALEAADVAAKKVLDTAEKTAEIKAQG